MLQATLLLGWVLVIGPGGNLQFLECAGQDAAQRIGARAANQQAQGNKQDRQGKLVSKFVDVEAMRQVDEVDSADHGDDYAEGSHTQEGPRKDGQTSRELCQAHKIADGSRLVETAITITGAILLSSSTDSGVTCTGT